MKWNNILCLSNNRSDGHFWSLLRLAIQPVNYKNDYDITKNLVESLFVIGFILIFKVLWKPNIRVPTKN